MQHRVLRRDRPVRGPGHLQQRRPTHPRSGSPRRPDATTALRPGDTLLLYTDGLVERRGQSLDVETSHVAATLAANRHLGLGQLADMLTERFVHAGHDDDVAILLYRSPIASHPSAAAE
ncbi:SpoIIE family protein phosphatase [Amycolatopsis sp. NPDC004378]